MDTNLTQFAASQLGSRGADLQRLATSQGVGNTDAIDAAAREFEAVMLATMLKPVFEGVTISEPFGGGEGEQMWKGLLVEEYAREMAASGGIGIADEIRAELLRAQESAVGETNH